MVKPDNAMRAAFACPEGNVISFPHLNELLAPHLLPLDPVSIAYTVRLDTARSVGTAVDIEVGMSVLIE